jgi:hypothetical protein
LSGSDKGSEVFARAVEFAKPEIGGKTGKNSGKYYFLIDLPKWEILSIDEGDRQEQSEEVLGATRLR